MLEYGESFEECAAWETFEESKAIVDPKDVRYVCTINAFEPELNYHNVGIFTGVYVKKSEFKFENFRPTK